MSSAKLRLGSWSALTALALASCSLDDRPLNYEYHALQAAGASGAGGSGAGFGDAGAPLNGNGEAGSPAIGGEGGVNPGSGNGEAGSGDAGAPPAAGGSANSAGGSGANAGAASSSAGSGGTASAAAGAPAGGAVSASAGAGPIFACGDLNHDLVDDCAQTLLQNSRFDTSIEHWDAESEMTETWGSVNASSATGSGSLSVIHTGNTGPIPSMVGARQCIPVTPNASYDVAARVQVGAGQTGTAGINVYFYDDAECHGNFVPPGNTPIEGGIAGTWIELATTAPLWIPGRAKSMYVRLFANKQPFQTTPLTVLIDDVLVAKRVMP